MIDPIHNHAYQEYNTNKIPPKTSSADAGGEKFSLNYSDEGVLYEPSNTETDEKSGRAAKEKQSDFRQAAALELSDLSGEKNKAPDAVPAGQQTLLDALRGLLSRAADALKKIWAVIWESAPSDRADTPSSGQDAPEILSADMLSAEAKSALSADTPAADSDAVSSGTCGETVSGGTVPAAPQTLSGLHAQNNADILNALKSGNRQDFHSLLTEDGRRVPARNSTLLTYYDSKGNLISPDASVQQRVLHGDRGSMKR